MSIFDASSLTLDSENAKAVSELVFEKKFADVEANKLRSIFSFQNGIVHNRKIPILGGFTGLSGYKITTCATTASANQIASSEKEWDPAYIGDRFEQCFADLQDNFWKYMLKSGVDKMNVGDTEYAAFVKMRLDEYISDAMMYRLIFFTDKDIVDGTNNSVDAAELKYFNTNFGVWRQIFDIVGTTAARRVTIALNAEATYADQAFDSTDTTNELATSILNDLIYKAHMDLRRLPVSERIIICTQTLADQYARERKSKSGIELAYSRTENGLDTFKIDGVEVLPMPTMDGIIDAYYNDGTKWFSPHRAIHTAKGNIVIGTQEEGNLSQLNSEYSGYHKLWYVDFGFNFDVKVIHDNLIQAAY